MARAQTWVGWRTCLVLELPSNNDAEFWQYKPEGLVCIYWRSWDEPEVLLSIKSMGQTWGWLSVCTPWSLLTLRQVLILMLQTRHVSPTRESRARFYPFFLLAVDLSGSFGALTHVAMTVTVQEGFDWPFHRRTHTWQHRRVPASSW